MLIKYSIIIPHYNDPDRLERLLKSIPTQRQDIQVIVIDDCSPDTTNLQALQNKYPQIKWEKTKVNGGAGAARNVGLAHVAGEYLLFADSDDEFTAGAFDILDETLSPDFDLTYYLAEAKMENSNAPSNRAARYNKFCLKYLKDSTPKNLLSLKSEHVVPVAKVYKSGMVKKLGIQYDETKVSNDVAFNVKCALSMQSINVVPQSIYVIYKTDESLTTQKDVDALFGRILVLDRLATELKGMGLEHNLSSAGYLLRSIAYGPKAFIKMLSICTNSDLKFDWKRFFSLDRWADFIKINREYKK